MSDDATQYFNAWTKSFGDIGVPEKLLCKWHVKKNWRKQILLKSPSEHRGWIEKDLFDLMDAESEAKFRILQTSFFAELRKSNCEEFLDYFRSNYALSPFRIREWALYARTHSSVNTNTHLESFHDKLKNNFLDGR